MMKQIKRYKKDVHGMSVSVMSRHIISDQFHFEIDFNQKKLMLRCRMSKRKCFSKICLSRTQYSGASFDPLMLDCEDTSV